MAEGRTKVYYKSDLVPMFDSTGAAIDGQFVVDMPNNLVAEASLGWSASPPSALGPTGIRLPKRIRPRHAVGVSPAGKRVRAVVATTAADLWTGTATTWTYIDNFGATITATRTGLVGEAATF